MLLSSLSSTCSSVREVVVVIMLVLDFGCACGLGVLVWEGGGVTTRFSFGSFATIISSQIRHRAQSNIKSQTPTQQRYTHRIRLPVSTPLDTYYSYMYQRSASMRPFVPYGKRTYAAYIVFAHCCGLRTSARYPRRRDCSHGGGQVPQYRRL